MAIFGLLKVEKVVYCNLRPILENLRKTCNILLNYKFESNYFYLHIFEEIFWFVRPFFFFFLNLTFLKLLKAKFGLFIYVDLANLKMKTFFCVYDWKSVSMNLVLILFLTSNRKINFIFFIILWPNPTTNFLN